MWGDYYLCRMFSNLENVKTLLKVKDGLLFKNGAYYNFKHTPFSYLKMRLYQDS